MVQDEILEELEYPETDASPRHHVWESDARDLPIPDNSADLIFTSPPYWKKRDYGMDDQIGQEPIPEEYVESLMKCFEEWERVLRSSGTIMLNIGDTYRNKSRAGVPWMLAQAARDRNWRVRSEIVWHKPGGMPNPAKDRLNTRHEYIFHFTPKYDYYFDNFGFESVYDDAVDVWRIPHDNNSAHLAPFPKELVERSLVAACPPAVCRSCGEPRERIIEKGLTELDTERSQAQRALERYEESDLTEEHIKAIQATGISDAGKGRIVQNESGPNTEEVLELAYEAKQVLGGYFREFTFPVKTTTGWTVCECGSRETMPGMVVDPFAGSGTTIKVARDMGFSAVGTDIDPPTGIEGTSYVEAKQ